jgi:hypothetical protein
MSNGTKYRETGQFCQQVFSFCGKTIKLLVIFDSNDYRHSFNVTRFQGFSGAGRPAANPKFTAGYAAVSRSPATRLLGSVAATPIIQTIPIERPIGLKMEAVHVSNMNVDNSEATAIANPSHISH